MDQPTTNQLIQLPVEPIQTDISLPCEQYVEELKENEINNQLIIDEIEIHKKDLAQNLKYYGSLGQLTYMEQSLKEMLAAIEKKKALLEEERDREQLLENEVKQRLD